MQLSKKLTAEFLGTAWLVLGGCGTAVLAGKGVGLVGISLAFGLTVVTMAFAIGHISGCHLNPAVSVGLFIAKKMPASELGAYIGAQIAGAIAGAGILLVVAGGIDGFTAKDGFAANGFGAHSPLHYSMMAGFIIEAVLTFFFLIIILGSTHERAPAGFAPLAIGLGLTLIHLISIPVTNTSVNPARSISQALFAGGDYLGQLWLFIVAPLVGAVAAGIVYPWMSKKDA